MINIEKYEFLALDILLGALFNDNEESIKCWKMHYKDLTLAEQIIKAQKECNL